MKRAFPQKVKPVSCYPCSDEPTAAGQSKQNPTGVNRKARTSAAMIGLALSMGASSLLLPRQDDGAAAAEPVAESTVAVTPLAQQVATLPGGIEVSSANTVPVSSSAEVEHVVREGQTMWQIARLYQVSIQTITAANNLPSDATIRVGQILRIPTASPVSSASSSQAGSIASETAKTERDQALNRLRQERDKLRDSLAELRGEGVERSSTQPPKVEPQMSQATEQSSASESVLSHRPIAEVAPQDQVQADRGYASETPDVSHGITHQVKPGETLGAIALTYGVPQRILVSANHIGNPDWLRANQSLVIPQLGTTLDTQSSVTVPTTQFSIDAVQPDVTPSEPTAPVDALIPDSVVYRVNPGDTLGEIANAYSVPQSSLVNANALQNPNLIVAGQVLRIPAPAIDQVSTPVVSAIESTPDKVNVEPLVSSVDTPQVATVSEPTVPTEVDNNIVSTVEAPVVVEPTVETVEESQRVATAPLSLMPEATPVAETPQPDHFAENLMAEIRDMRDRYRAEHSQPEANVEQSDAQEPIVVATASELLAVTTPAAAEAENPEVRPVVAPEPPELVAEAPPTASQSQLVAVAPLGSENYAPLVQPIAGQVVSPDLPPLPEAGAYLPSTSPQFDGFIWPARGTLTSGYGWRWGRMHRGIDIGAPVGTPVYAAAEGVVEFSGWNSGGYGNMVEIRHADGTMTRYAHHSRNLVRAGQRVEQGQHIAAVGSTGYSTGPHLHFEVHLPNQGTVNPIAYLPR